jgi:hypothetical protein
MMVRRTVLVTVVVLGLAGPLRAEDASEAAARRAESAAARSEAAAVRAEAAADRVEKAAERIEKLVEELDRQQRGGRRR